MNNIRPRFFILEKQLFRSKTITWPHYQVIFIKKNYIIKIMIKIIIKIMKKII